MDTKNQEISVDRGQSIHESICLNLVKSKITPRHIQRRKHEEKNNVA